MIERQKLQDKLQETSSEDLISKRLKEDYLKQAGKFKRIVAGQYSKIKANDIRYLKCKEHRSTVTCICVSSDNKFMYSGSKDSGIVKCMYPYVNLHFLICHTLVLFQGLSVQ